MSKFKVGDRVKLIPNPMKDEDLMNTTGTVLYIDGDESYSVSVEWDDYVYGHDCFGKGKFGFCFFMDESELYLVDTKIYPKDKIKDGDFVKSRDGEVGFVRNHCIYYGLDAIKVSFYNRNLYNDIDMDYDIMTIYRADEIGDIDVVWERYEFTEDDIQIAKLISNEIKYITRDSNGNLFGYKNKPKKTQTHWYDEFIAYDINIFNNHFINIHFSDDEPVSIDDILEFER